MSARRRYTANASASGTAGVKTQRSSEASTAMPRAERNRDTPIGETSMTRKGEKNRSFENGQRKAMPAPPLVKLSRTPCEAAAANKKRKTTGTDARNQPDAKQPKSASAAANASEWVKPRRANSDPKKMPNWIPMTSRSGTS